MEAPGIRTTERPPRKSAGDTLRGDVAGFAGIFERGPAFLPTRVEDEAELRRRFGGFRELEAGGERRYALTPLALSGFHQNGGGTVVVVRLAGRGMRASLGRMLDPATGVEIGLVASSPGRWGDGVGLSLRLRVEHRALGIELAGAAPTSAAAGRERGLEDGRVARVFSAADPTRRAYGLLRVAPAGWRLRSAMAVPDGPLVVEILASEADVAIRGPWGVEHLRELSLLPEHPRYVWRVLEARGEPSPWTEIQSFEPAAESTRDWAGAARGEGHEGEAVLATDWASDPALRLALLGQTGGVSPALRAVLPEGFAAAAELGPRFVLPEGGGPRPPDPVWDPAGAPDLGGGELLVTLRGGDDDTAHLDASAFRAGIQLLARHPAPSLVCLPELMVAQAPQLPRCEREPFEHPRLEPLPPPPGPCGERTAPPPPPQEPPRPEALPGEQRPSELPPIRAEQVRDLQHELVLALVEHKDTRGDRVALLDPLPGLSVADIVARARALEGDLRRDAGGRAPYVASLAAQLYPWLRTIDPLRPESAVLAVPPSGHVAGVMSRTAREGTPGARFGNIAIGNVVGTMSRLDDDDRARLNAGHVCAIHAVSGDGVRVLGVRSLDRSPAPARYLPASRVVAYLRRALRELGRTLVFEPNDALLELRIRFALEAVLGDLHRAGVLVGRSADEAYRVRCDDSTTPSDLRDQGVVVAEVQVAPAIPLEFVEIRIGFTRDGASVDDTYTEAA